MTELGYSDGIAAARTMLAVEGNWATADQPNLPLRSAKDPRIERWYQEDQVMNVVRSDPLSLDRVSELTLDVRGELADVFDGSERVIAVVIQRPYMRQVHTP